MKYLNPYSFFAALILLASCHSSDVALRHSRIRSCMSEDIRVQTAQKENHETSPKDTIILNAATATLIASVKPKTVSAASTKTLQSLQNPPISAKQQTNQTKNAAKQYAAARSTANHKMLKQPGFFGNIGYSFGVVGIVFIVIGLVLLLIGGLIIDTLAALAIAFGFVFILIWLVLAILQGLFDVIL
jgi:hypothetical protein